MACIIACVMAACPRPGFHAPSLPPPPPFTFIFQLFKFGIQIPLCKYMYMEVAILFAFNSLCSLSRLQVLLRILEMCKLVCIYSGY
jgi:hypothetical protein